jgi:L-alanine-DL-glutamate epimerase-like enolase superfamily enzyme
MITRGELTAGVEPFRKIRRAAGGRVEVMGELRSMWSTHTATRTCRALEDVGALWAEDSIAKTADARAQADLRRQTRTPIWGSETLGGALSFRGLWQRMHWT